MFPHSKLKDADILAAKPKSKSYKLSEGGGLYLLVTPYGAKYWRMKYRFAGKEKTYAIGVYPQVTIKMAIMARDDAKDSLSCGIDPSDNKKKVKQTKIARNSTPPVFEYIRHQDGGITFKKHKQSLTIAANEIELLLNILKLSL